VSIPPIISIRALEHVYGDDPARRVVLQSLALDVAPGEVVVLTGASGSGKTTLLTLCGALRSVQHGQVRILGELLSRLDREQQRELRSAIGFIFQAHNLIDALTAGQNVVMSLLGRVSPAEASARAEATLGGLGLATRVDALPEELSGGEKQRVAVAGALVRQPRLILADEPTASLDDVSASVVIDAIRTVATRSSCAVLVATHDPRVFAIADRVLHLVDGALAEQFVRAAIPVGRATRPREYACAG
jgi:putative ABC transport system ATP-binding protein